MIKVEISFERACAISRDLSVRFPYSTVRSMPRHESDYVVDGTLNVMKRSLLWFPPSPAELEL